MSKTERADLAVGSSTSRRSGALLLAMAANVFLLSMVQTLVVPALPLIGQQLGVDAATAGWVATATMLMASAVTPLFGRLGDVYGPRRVVLVALALTLVGGVLAATTHSIEVLIAARALQGTSFGLFPLAVSALRHQYPPARLSHALSVTASALGIGSGFALVATGLLTQGDADYRRIFWLAVILTVACIVLSAVVLPAGGGRGGRVDYLGAFLLGVGLVALLIPISQGNQWGWATPLVIGLFVTSALTLALFGILQARSRDPLVALTLLTRRPVLATNLASAFVGVAMFSVFLAATFFVQSPREVTGYGFGADVLTTSLLYMLPGAIIAIPLGPIAGRVVSRFGARLVLVVASMLGLVALMMMAFLHANSTEFIIALVLSNVAVAVAYASMPALLVANVSPNETGVANSINSIMRTIGGAIGTAVIVTILASSTTTYSTKHGTIELPTESAFTAAFVLGGAAFAVAALLALFAVGRQRSGAEDSEENSSQPSVRRSAADAETALQLLSSGRVRRELHLKQVLGAFVVLLILIAFVAWATVNPAFEWGVFGAYFFRGRILEGLWTTIWLTFVVVAISIVFGMVLAVMRLSRVPVLVSIAWGYVWVFRSIPVLVQLLLWFNIGYFIRPVTVTTWFGETFTVNTNSLITALGAAILGLSLHGIAIAGEIIRGGVLAVPAGQTEAGRVLGFSDTYIFGRIVFPQALRSVVPAMANMLVEQLKGTSIVSVLAVRDLLYSAQEVYATNYKVVPLLMVATIWYVIVTSILSVGQYALERRLARSRRRAGSAQPRVGASGIALRVQPVGGER